MRLFIALEPSPAFREALAELQERLRAAGVGGRYLEPSNLHMTLAFIGEWPEAEKVTALLPAVRQPFSIALSHVGLFPGADVLWAGTAPSEALNGLAEQVRQVLTDAAIPFDRKGFCPHITLARKPKVPSGVDLSRLGVPAAAMTVKEVCLYRSERGERGMLYTVTGRGPSDSADGLQAT